MDILIRKEEKEDFKAIYEVNRLAFGQENESKLIDNIRDSSSFIPDLSLVAVELTEKALEGGKRRNRK